MKPWTQRDTTDWTLNDHVEECRDQLLKLRMVVKEWLQNETASTREKELAVAYGELAGELIYMLTLPDNERITMRQNFVSAFVRVAKRQSGEKLSVPVNYEDAFSSLEDLYKSAKQSLPVAVDGFSGTLKRNRQWYLEYCYALAKEAIIALAGCGQVITSGGIYLAELAGAIRVLIDLDSEFEVTVKTRDKD